jgi:hypothetical protein
MNLKSLPKELLAEALNYIADHEELSSLDEALGGDHTLVEVRGALREMAAHLRREAVEQRSDKSLMDVRKDTRLSQKVRSLLSVLSPTDEKKLLTQFGLLDS